MSRYIDIDDVANAIYHHFPSIRTMADARGIIDEAPTIDIVRCKECRHWRNEHICMAWSRHGTIETKPDNFCSYGERTNGQTLNLADE